MKMKLLVVPVLLLALFLGLSESVMFCYFGSWATYRHGNGKFDPENIEPGICTHLVFTFAGLDESTSQIKVLDPYNELCDNWGKCGFDRTVALKQLNTNLKVLLAVGGWNEGSQKYSKMAADAGKRKIFIDTSIELLLRHKFDGFDMDWEYPTQREGNAVDWTNFITLLRELRTELNRHGLLLTAAVSAGKLTIDAAYDVPALAAQLDYINLMAYDLHGAWDTYTHHQSGLYKHPSDTGNNTYLNANFAVTYWIHLGAPASKLVLGMPLYGRCWSLDSAAETGYYAPAGQPGNPGPYTNSPGFMGYNEICEKQLKESWTVVTDPSMNEPYAFYLPNNRIWCSYDDAASLQIKAKYARDKGLGGAMVWSVETDDFLGLCHPRPFHLTKTIHETFIGGVLPPPPTAATTTMDPSITSTSTTTPKPPPPSGVCQNPGYNVDPDDCIKFYQCVWVGDSYTVYPGECPQGTLFNSLATICDWKESVCALGICPNNCP